MKFALVDGERKPPSPKGKGLCPICGEDVIAKCGNRIVHHWAHKGRINCDPWSEKETQWHRDWKSHYPEDCQEIHHKAPDGEIHVADIKTPSGIYIEVQHSPMSDQERISRESFYKNLVWIIDGSTFIKNFQIHHMLPDPKSELAQDIVWSPARHKMEGANRGMFFKFSEAKEHYPHIKNKNEVTGGLCHFFHQIQDKIMANYIGHHQYTWVRPRSTWLDAQCPVYIDFGNHCLYKLGKYDEYLLPCIKIVCKKHFIKRSISESDINNLDV